MIEKEGSKQQVKTDWGKLEKQMTSSFEMVLDRIRLTAEQTIKHMPELIKEEVIQKYLQSIDEYQREELRDMLDDIVEQAGNNLTTPN